LADVAVDGIVTTDKKSKRKVLRKIPPSVIKKAKGLAIFTSMRSGIAPFGGAGGAGLVMARLPDGCKLMSLPARMAS
jgi:lipid-binding SYLF domain-containing protein